MIILLTAIGSRGDMEPFLSLGKLLQERGHEVICQFPEQFRSLSDDAGLAFETLGAEWLDFSHTALPVLEGSDKREKKKVLKRIVEIDNLMEDRIYETITRLNPDKVVRHPKTKIPVVFEILKPGSVIYLCPLPFMNSTKKRAHSAFKSVNRGALLNKFSYYYVNRIAVKKIMSAVKRLNISGITRQKVKNTLKHEKTMYTLSPELFKKPDDWHENIHLVGYHERDKFTSWKPDKELLTFLKKHKKPLLVTFGSMINDAPLQRTQTILNILERHNIPAIINTFSGGLVAPESYNKELFHFVLKIPYDWIFPKVYAVIHHGGAGTFHAATKSSCPSLIIPHKIDQYVWNEVVDSKKIGPKGLEIIKITEANLEPKILDLYHNEAYKKFVGELAENMQKEKQLVETMLDVVLK